MVYGHNWEDLQEQIGLSQVQGGRLIGATCGIIEQKHGWVLIRAWVLNRDNTAVEIPEFYKRTSEY